MLQDTWYREAVNKNQYSNEILRSVDQALYPLYIDKQRYIDRLNRLVPMEWLLPTIGLGGAEFLREKQNNKSN